MLVLGLCYAVGDALGTQCGTMRCNGRRNVVLGDAGGDTMGQRSQLDESLATVDHNIDFVAEENS